VIGKEQMLSAQTEEKRSRVKKLVLLCVRGGVLVIAIAIIFSVFILYDSVMASRQPRSLCANLSKIATGSHLVG
jgi:hypothetical protein